MSYELHIIRPDGRPETAHWSEGDGGISFAEWDELVRADPELAIDYSERLTEDELEQLVAGTPELAECRTADGYQFTMEQDRRLRELAEDLKRDESPDMEQIRYDTADWSGHPSGEERSLWFGDGRISTKNPDVATLDKLLQMADSLKARVQGDDGEFYRRTALGFECFESGRGWLRLEEYHRGRPDWAPAIIREIARMRSGTRPAP